MEKVPKDEQNVALFVAAAALLTPVHGATIAVTNTFAPGQIPPAGVVGTAPGGPVFATGVHALGITFSFFQNTVKVDAIYGSTVDTSNNVLTPLSDPVLDGPADGILKLTFDALTTFLSFDVALGILQEDSGGQVTVRGTTQAFTKEFTTTGNNGFMGFFSSGSFLWTPPDPFIEAQISFHSNAARANFVIDNLAYDAPDLINASPTPEPGSWISFGSGALLLGLLTGLRQCRARRLSR